MENPSKKIVLLSPPFYSHFQPLKTLGRALRSLGAQVSIACSESFRKEIQEGGMGFYPLNINKNQNTGIAKNTQQNSKEKNRLEEFFQATYKGPVNTLITQADHRIMDMFSNPQELIYSIQQLYQSVKPDLVIVDQLSYGATLALVGLEIPFITFCPPHPGTIQTEGTKGLTEFWPTGLEPEEQEKKELRQKQQELRTSFSKAFKHVFKANFPRGKLAENFLNNPFSLTSPKGVVYNYPNFSHRTSKASFKSPDSHYLHYCFEPEELEGPLKSQLLKEAGRKVLISFGTFLSERRDVIEVLMQSFLEHKDSWHIYVATGGNEKFFRKFSSESITRASFLPQKALLPHMDVVVHHGGTNTFTETLYYGKPMIIFPFSSDQFAVAYDAEKNRIGEVLDPNTVTKEKLYRALGRLDTKEVRKNLIYWQEKSRENGPIKGAQWIINQL